MTHTIKRDPFAIPWPLANSRIFRTLIANPLESLLGLRQCRQIYNQLPESDSPGDFCRTVLERLGVACVPEGDGLDRIPRQGPAIVVADHPFGAVEEGHDRDPASFPIGCMGVANTLLQRIPQLRDALMGGDILSAC